MFFKIGTEAIHGRDHSHGRKLSQCTKAFPLHLQRHIFNKSTSSASPFPLTIRPAILFIQYVPSRHGVHFPHDSCLKKLTVLLTSQAMSTVSSNIMTEAEPSGDFSLSRQVSYARGVSSVKSFAITISEDAPADMTAFTALSSIIPPPYV